MNDIKAVVGFLAKFHAKTWEKSDGLRKHKWLIKARARARKRSRAKPHTHSRRTQQHANAVRSRSDVAVLCLHACAHDAFSRSPRCGADR